MNPPEATNDNHRGNAYCNTCNRLIMIEKRHKRPRACKHQRKYRSNAQFNPKEIAGKRISKSLTLNNQFRKSSKAKAAKEKPKSGHHGHDAEIRRRKQPR